jgi:hypothetical protein
MTYVGSWRASFAWHTEDADLYSINYLHTGAPKSWYCVAPAARARFESMAASYFPELAQSCPAFLRHKDIMMSPTVLRQHGIAFTCALQRPGEFVVNTAGAYHTGFNHGFNVAEAVNFATPAWLALGRAALRCGCVPDAVTIDMSLFSDGAKSQPADTQERGAAAAAARRSPQQAARRARAPQAPPEQPAARRPGVGDVVAVVGADAARKRYMYLGRVLGAGAPGCLRLEWLEQRADGLYWPAPSADWEEEEEALITALRYEHVGGGVRLRTHAAALLGARLVADGAQAKRARKR